MTQQDQPVRLRFDSFELDLLTGELRKEGRLIKLQDQPMKMLILLATRAGELVGREEIQKALWSDSRFVEFEHGINTAMRKIREALGDDLENPRFVETLPRKGYRFMPAVVRVGAAGGKSYDSAETYPPSQHLAEEGEDGSLPMIGQTISHYTIEKKLGQGGMGVVYRARDTRLNRTVALKMVRPELAADPGLRRRLEAEARAASALSHPVIATVHDFEQVGECAFIVYEYVEGTNLREVMRVRALELSEVLDICIKIADGMVAAHDGGIVHRDLKPENVMIGEGGRVKILDLGLAKVSLPVAKGRLSAPGPGAAPTMATPPGLLVGTVNYMSPEQLEAEEVDHRTDVFSFGVMLYELAVGHHPFVGKSPSSTIGNILKEDPTSLARWNRQLPADLDRVIRKCVRKQRRERYQSVRELLVDVENIRRDLRSPVAVATVTSDSELALSRGMARWLLVFAQCGYLALYLAALYYLEDLERALERILLLPVPLILPLILIAAMCGIAVRLYLLSAIGLDHPATGVKFEKLFPFVVVLDGLWAASPLLMARSFGIGLALACVAALAYLPFSQRTLVRRAYRVTGDHRSEA